MFNFSFYLLLTFLIVVISMLFASLRRKFFLFILTVVFCAIWGFMLDLDGMMLILLTAEFTIVLLFLMTYIQLYSNYQFISKSFNYLPLLCLVGLGVTYYSPLYSFSFYSNYYSSINHVVASDFFILYYFLFTKLPSLVIAVTLLISFFSFFFIVLYFSLKFSKNAEATALKNIYFLRKQILVKQTNFNNSVYTFQN